MGRDLTRGIESAYAVRTDLLVVALTGRTGSGCTTTAKALAGSLTELAISPDGLSEMEKRKIAICQEFSKRQWEPFKAISVSTIILSFLVQEEWPTVEEFFTSQRLELQLPAIKAQHQRLHSESTYPSFLRLAKDHDQSGSVEAWEFYAGPLSDAASVVRRTLGTKYSPLFQTLGDNIRRSGSAISKDVDPTQAFALITRVKRVARAARRWDQAEGNHSTRIVIDAVRNPLELVYLRDQFATFFAIAITADDAERRARLMDSGMPQRDVDTLDSREYSKKSLQSYEDFVSQNLKECIQKADVFFHNPGEPGEFEENKVFLYRQILRYVALMLRPGLVTPTPDERCMQLAFVAKLNSGCISRQVGAAVADANASIKAVGWNDVPRGQVPCLLRDVTTLLNGHDGLAFSDYEVRNTDFKRHLGKQFANASSLKPSSGLPCPFCFKDAYNDVTGEKNQVHTRSLHAEENAFLQLAKHGNSGIDGGVLFTTASPCELCSKKAYQLGIKEVVYVDPYPGISASHVLKSGISDLRPKLRLFSGAVGNAYHRLYEPLLPIKDEYNARLADDPEQAPLL